MTGEAPLHQASLTSHCVQLTVNVEPPRTVVTAVGRIGAVAVGTRAEAVHALLPLALLARTYT